jgi:hypothetical protein
MGFIKSNFSKYPNGSGRIAFMHLIQSSKNTVVKGYHEFASCNKPATFAERVLHSAV